MENILEINETAKEEVFAIEMIDICKSFLNGKVIANDNINLKVKKNEIHAIIGENGAGKSTLMSILFGIYSQDSGSIKINGKSVYFSSAKDAGANGLGMVHQHFKLVSTYSVYQNIILGSEDCNKCGILQNKKSKEKINNLIKEYEFNLNINTKISNLTVGQEQKTEILKLLYRESDILIFDEPTAVLSQDEIIQFLKMIRKFKENGKTIIIITHKLQEIKDVADSATVIRHGKYISSFNVADKTIIEMAEEMVGKRIVDVKNKSNKQFGREILNVNNLNIKLDRVKKSSFYNKNVKEQIQNKINFNIKAGEIFAIAGVEGNGQSELASIISGLSKSHGAEIKILGNDISKDNIYKRNLKGLSHVPEDRHKHGLILDMSIATNCVINQIDNKPFSKLGFLNNLSINEYARSLIKKYDVRGTTRGTAPSRLLSGGNQQKLIIARELTKKHRLVILVQPTRGLDLGAIEYIHYQILREKEKGNAILLISYELDEILALADTIAVIYNGSFIEIGNKDIMTKQHIGQLMAGKD